MSHMKWLPLVRLGVSEPATTHKKENSLLQVITDQRNSMSQRFDVALHCQCQWVLGNVF